MSTTQPPVAASSTGPSPSPTPNSNTSTLLFGFLVSALSVFAIFMTSAIVWNRLIARRHAIDAMSTTNAPHSPRIRRPKIWDIWIMPDEQPPPWLNVKPVTAQKCDCPLSSSQIGQTEQRISFWRRHVWDRLPLEITYLFRRPVPPAPTAPRDTDTSRVELSHGSDVQFSLMIAMPRASQLARAEVHNFHELVFATTNALYHDPASS